MFQELLKSVYTVKLGFKKNATQFYIKNTDEVRNLFFKFIK
ncbi:MAG: hypothetical protein ACJAZK_000319 [Psychroserpens sp.]|jgi:hypothetical protein